MMKKKFLSRKWFTLACLLLILLSAAPGVLAKAKLVYIVPIEGLIEPGVAGFVSRSLDRAATMGASAVILEIDTTGGAIASATEMKKAILASEVPVVAYVKNKALSAGSLITIAAEKVAMAPGSAIGAATPVALGKTDEIMNAKMMSAWKAEMASAAEARRRDPNIAKAMADPSITIPGLDTDPKEPLSLTAAKAKETGIADYIVANRNDLVHQLQEKKVLAAGDYEIEELKLGWAERIAWIITNPFVSSLLLLLGFAGLLIESLIPGWGVAGSIGLGSLGLFFAGHIMAGVTGWEAVLLFLLGVIALVFEIFVIPGFGVAGILGIGMIIWSIFMASVSSTQAIISLTIALLGTIVILFVGLRLAGKRNLWGRIALGDKQEKGTGYVAPKADLAQLVGLEGMSITPLRPAGSAEIEGHRIDVVTEGEFLPAQCRLKVIKVEGVRVVVRAVSSETK